MVKVRLANSKDLERVTVLEASTYPEDAISKRSFRRFIESETADFFVLEVNGNVEGYVVVLYRNNTNLARLYALVVSERCRHKGYGRLLLHKGEELADERHSLFLRTEVAVSNKVAQKLLIGDGFHSIELREAYFPVTQSQSSDALVLQKLLPRYELGEDAGVGATETYVPMLTQSTEFTCGPASLLMALDYFGYPSYDPQSEELEIWREATTIYMTSGHGGCGPYGLARAALKRGLNVRVEVNTDQPLFVDSVRHEQKKAVIERIQQVDIGYLRERNVAVSVGDYTLESLCRDLAAGSLVMALISTYLFDGIRAPHWVLICAADDDFVYINDPDYDTLPWQSPTERQYLPIPVKTFSKAFGYGGKKQKAAVILSVKNR